MILGLMFSLPAFSQAQEKKNPTGANEIQSREIERLHRELSEAIQNTLGQQKVENFIIPLGLGLRRILGQKEPFVYQEEARIKLSNGVPESVEFYYYQSNEKTVFTQERTITNNNIRSTELGKIVIAYKSNMDQPVTYTLESLHSESSRQRVLSMYRDYLLECLKYLNLQATNRKATEQITLQKVLYIGTK
ncbi:MAG: hypothetical protein NZM25_08820 [Leptospiraceae bacterium]|nr:hypothetical protein [Leptospiraceae bacterium]MDW8306820.1 hypothetical protein [Leptospiraceae bacterium]